MSNLTAISKENHAHKSWTRFTSYQFAAKDNLVPLVAAEIAQSVLNFPMGFIKQQDRFVLVGMLSIIPGQNMFVGPDGRWLGGYVPAAFRGYPFRLARSEKGNELILCVDESSGLIQEKANQAEPFFDENGEISEQVQGILDFLSQIETSRSLTEKAVASLADAKVLTEWNLKIKEGEQEQPVTGLYRVDEAKLNAVDDQTFLALRKSSALPLVYAQLLSMANIQLFEKLAKVHEQMAAKQSTQPGEVDLDKLFDKDDLIKFD
jgi:hypothetical protein